MLGKDTTPMFGCVAVCPHFASPQSSGILPQHIKMAQSQSQWVLQTKIFVVGQTYHTYNACFQAWTLPHFHNEVRVNTAELRGHRAAVLCVAWAEGIEGNLLASGAADGHVIIWHVPWW